MCVWGWLVLRHLGGVLVSPAAAWAKGGAPMIFDQPIKTEIATFAHDLPSQPNMPASRVKATVTCSYYPRFVVKVVHWEGDEGSGIFTVPVEHGSDRSCDDPEDTNPKTVADSGGWLAGVKNDLVVTGEPDTLDDGTGFTIFRPAVHKIIFSGYGQVDDKFRLRLISIKESKAGVKVRYDRIFVGSCSMAEQVGACADRFMEQTGIDKRSFAKCAENYRLLEEKDLRWRCTISGRIDRSCLVNGFTPAEERYWNEDPSAIAYDVQVFIPADEPPVQLDYYSASLSTGKNYGPAVARLTTEGGLIECFPAD